MHKLAKQFNSECEVPSGPVRKLWPKSPHTKRRSVPGNEKYVRKKDDDSINTVHSFALQHRYVRMLSI